MILIGTDTACESWFAEYIGDGYCDDMNNVEDCQYDGGDCCGPDIYTDYCVECICYESSISSSGTTPTPFTTSGSGATNEGGCESSAVFLGNGFCEDEYNNEGCQFDGGDCCGSNVNTSECKKCQCLDPAGGGSSGKEIFQNYSSLLL